MTGVETNRQTPMQNTSYRAISSLALSICAAICFLQQFMDFPIIKDLDDDYILGLTFICGVLSFFLGLTALIQKRSLRWLSLISFGICVVIGILVVIGLVSVFIYLPK